MNTEDLHVGAARVGTGDHGRFYLDDLTVGQRFTSPAIEIGRERIISFASEFDPQPFHLDEKFAKGALFRGLAASGWHTAALTMRLLVDGGLPIAGGIIGTNVELEWPHPTRPGDVLHVESEILDIAASQTRPDRGGITAQSKTLNQRGEVVQITRIKLVAARRPAAARSTSG